MSVEVILFDVGGVLGTNGWDRESRTAACERFDLDWADLQDRHDFVSNAFETGAMDLDTYLERTVFYRQRDFDRDEFTDFMFGRSKPHPDVIALAAALASGGRYLLATLNNESRELNEHRIELFGLAEHFQMFLSSCYLGVRKPEADIYHLAVDITQRSPEQCLFVDDREINLECARDIGLNTIHFTGIASLREGLAQHGVTT